MRIGIVYTGITSYMTDCWRELARRQGVELRIWIEDTKAFRFKGDRAKALRDLWCHWDYSENLTDIELRQAEHEILAFAPDIIFVCGWSRELPPYIASSGRLAHIPMVLEMDMPWEWRLRKFAARFVLKRRLRRFSAVFVPGRSSARYARWLGFPKSRIYEGRNCIDFVKFAKRDRAYGKAGSGFLFVGRRVREKGLDILLKAYAEYQRLGGSWLLDVPEYVEPEDVPRALHEHECLVVPSRWEPWGMVVLEAIAAGIKVIVSDKVCSRYDLPVDAVFKAGSSRSLALAMLGVERNMGTNAACDEKRYRELLEKYDVTAWASRVLAICSDVLHA